MILAAAYLLYDIRFTCCTLKVIPELSWNVFVNNRNNNDTGHCFIVAH